MTPRIARDCGHELGPNEPESTLCGACWWQANLAPSTQENSLIREYHWRAGVVYARLENGDVQLRLTRSLIIPASEWKSIIAAMSLEGENAGTFDLASRVHDYGNGAFQGEAKQEKSGK